MSILIIILIFILLCHISYNIFLFETKEKCTQCTQMPKMRAFIINGDKDGGNKSVRMKERWDRTKYICYDVLGFDCQRVPAYYVTSNMKEDIKSKCGKSFMNEDVTLRHVIGCKNAHRKVLEAVIRHGKRSIIFEDDIILTLNTNDILYKIKDFIEETTNKDLAYLGHCWGDQCTHAYIVSPEAAKKLLDSIDWCNKEPVDNLMADLCAIKELDCVYAKDYKKQKPEGSWSEGLILQEGEPIRNSDNF